MCQQWLASCPHKQQKPFLTHPILPQSTYSSSLNFLAHTLSLKPLELFSFENHIIVVTLSTSLPLKLICPPSIPYHSFHWQGCRPCCFATRSFFSFGKGMQANLKDPGASPKDLDTKRVSPSPNPDQTNVSSDPDPDSVELSTNLIQAWPGQVWI